MAAKNMMNLARPMTAAILLSPCGVAHADLQTQVVAVARTPAGATGGQFDAFGNARINEFGEVLFWARNTANTVATNDECTGAIPIGFGATYFTTLGAADGQNIGCAARSDVWFEFTDLSDAPVTNVQIYVAGAEFSQPQVSILQDNCDTLVPMACGTSGNVANFSFTAAMRTVKLRVGSATPGQSGDGLLVVRQITGGPTISPYHSLTDGALWSDVGGTLSPILRESTTTFDPALLHESFSIASWSNHGAAATSAVQATPNYATTRGVLLDWNAQTAAATQVAIDTIPPAAPFTPTIPGPASVTDDGAIAFALLDGTSITYGATTHAALSAAPGLDGLTWQNFDQPSVSSNGHVAWRSRLAGTGVDATNDVALWKDTGSGPVLFVRAGQQVPVAKPGVVFSQIGSDLGVDAAGGVTFWAELSGPGITAANRSGIWSDRSGELVQIARAGSPAPEAGAGAVFASFTRRPMVNAAGDIALAAYTSGGSTTTQDNSGLWVFRANNTRRLVIREGAAAPSASPGTVFATFGEPVINNRGDLAFVATLRAGDTTPTTAQALYFAGAGQGLLQIARAGTAVEVATGDTRTTREILFGTGRAQGGHGQFNSTATLLYELAFTDRTSALFKTTVVCTADFDNSGIVEVADIFAYLIAWFAEDAAAEWDGVDGIDVADLLAYLTQWFAGC